MWIWVGDLVGTNMFSVEEELPWKQREPDDAPGCPELCPTLGACYMQRDTEGEKKNTSASMFTLRLGSHAGLPAQPGRCLAQPLRGMLSPETAPPASPPSAWGQSHLHQ